MKEKFKNIWIFASPVVTIIIAVAISFCICHGVGSQESYSYRVFQSENKLEMTKIKALVVEEIEDYIHQYAPNSAVNGIAIFDACEAYDVDIRFVLAQGHLESHFGTRGIAAKTNSIFNVKAYDGRSAEDMIEKGHGFKHPDESIEPYLKLLTEDYLVDNKTEFDMFKKYVNKNGQRFASSTSYESDLLDKFNKISTATKIDSLMQEYNRYKIICNI